MEEEKINEEITPEEQPPETRRWVTSAEVFKLFGLSIEAQYQRRKSYRRGEDTPTALPYYEGKQGRNSVLYRIEDVEQNILQNPVPNSSLCHPQRAKRYFEKMTAPEGLQAIAKACLERQGKIRRKRRAKAQMQALRAAKNPAPEAHFVELPSSNGHSRQNEITLEKDGVKVTFSGDKNMGFEIVRALLSGSIK